MIKILLKYAVLLSLLVTATACTEGGYPSTDTEMWGIVVIFLGLFALAGFFIWCITR